MFNNYQNVCFNQVCPTNKCNKSIKGKTKVQGQTNI